VSFASEAQLRLATPNLVGKTELQTFFSSFNFFHSFLNHANSIVILFDYTVSFLGGGGMGGTVAGFCFFEWSCCWGFFFGYFGQFLLLMAEIFGECHLHLFIFLFFMQY